MTDLIRRADALVAAHEADSLELQLQEACAAILALILGGPADDRA